MSARSTLAKAVAGEPCSCGCSDCPRPEFLIDAFRREVLREAAEKIRAQQGPSDVDQRFTIYNNGWYDARTECADLIDPDKED